MASPSRRRGTATDVTFTIRPEPDPRNRRIAAWVNRKVPRKLVAMIRCAVSNGVRAIGFMLAMPALLIKTSRHRNRLLMSLNKRRTAGSSVTSRRACV